MQNDMSFAPLKTICYADIFDFPMTFEELRKYLISNKPVSKKELLVLLEKNQDIIKKEGKYYFLSGHNKNTNLREERKKYSREKLFKARKIAEYLSFIPQVLMIGISGSLSVHNSKKSDDIDFFIITKTNRLWTARFIMFFLLTLLNIRRKRGEVCIQDKICPNMLVSENRLDIQKNQQNLFCAHEIVQLMILVNKNQTYQKFICSNPWILNYLPNSIKINKMKIKGTSSRKNRVNLFGFFLGRLLDIIEIVLFYIQASYMKRHQTCEVVLKDMAKFHPEDKSVNILKGYRKKYIFYKTKYQTAGKEVNFKKTFTGNYIYSGILT